MRKAENAQCGNPLPIKQYLCYNEYSGKALWQEWYSIKEVSSMAYEVLEEQIRSLPKEALPEVEEYIKSVHIKYEHIDSDNLDIGFGMWRDRDISLQSIRQAAWQR